MTAETPSVSVVTAVFNGERYLQEAIDSVLAQDLAEWELIVIDDGSTDRSRDLVLSYADPRIRLHVNERNLGLAPSLNIGLRAARAPYIARLDADDVAEPARLAEQVRFLDAHADTWLVGSAYIEIDDAGRRGQLIRLPTDDLSLRWAMLLYCPFVHSAATFRREPVLAELGGYDESLRYSMDYDLWSRIATRGRVANLSAPLVRYRLHDEAMTAGGGEGRTEGVHMRSRTVASILGWPPPVEEHLQRFAAMRALLHGWARDDSSVAIERGAADLLELLAAFSRRHAEAGTTLKQHRESFERALSAQLMLDAADRARKEPFGALRLVRRALRVRAGSALHPRIIRKCGARFAKSFVTRAHHAPELP